MAAFRARRRILGGTLSLVLMAGCGTGSVPTASPSSAPPPTPSATADASAAPSPSGPIVLPAPEKTALKWGQSGTITSGALPLAVALGMDLPEKYGLDIEFFEFSGGSQAAQAMLAGQVDVSDNSGGPIVASLTTDTPLITLYVTRHNLTDNMYAQAAVKTADDLRGKAVAISSFGSQSHAGALLAIKSLGLTETDVTITQVGNDAARLAALQGGSVAASMNDATRELELAGLGFTIMVRLAEVEGIGGVPLSTFSTTRAFADANPNTVMTIVAMLLEASVEMRKDHAKTAEYLAEAAQIPLDEAVGEVDVVLNGPFEPIDGRCDPEVMAFTQQVLVATNPDIADVDPNQACSNEVLDKLAEMGFQKQIGVPGY